VLIVSSTNESLASLPDIWRHPLGDLKAPFWILPDPYEIADHDIDDEIAWIIGIGVFVECKLW